MRELNFNELTSEEKQVFRRISATYLGLYEGYTKKSSARVKFEDKNINIFEGNALLFSRFITQLFELFGVEIEHLPFKEFQKFPRVIDVLSYIFEKIVHGE